MLKFHLAFVLALLVLPGSAMAGFAATGQPCELSPEQARPEILATCSVEITNIDAEIQLIGKRPNKVGKIGFLYAGENKPRQILKLTATPLIDPETVAVMFVDFNFDGHKDFAIMTSIQTSENVKYLFFLYDPQTKKFIASPAMNPIVNPEVMATEKSIRSFWRQTPNRSGWNMWQWQGGAPFIATRIEQTVTSQSLCRQTTTRYAKGKVISLATATCR